MLADALYEDKNSKLEKLYVKMELKMHHITDYNYKRFSRVLWGGSSADFLDLRFLLNSNANELPQINLISEILLLILYGK